MPDEYNYQPCEIKTDIDAILKGNLTSSKEFSRPMKVNPEEPVFKETNFKETTFNPSQYNPNGQGVGTLMSDSLFERTGFESSIGNDTL